MTAEIAILNKSAVALAADSKVTLSVGGKQKTYDTANKLFSLSKTEPMGAMIYGNAEFMQFPWETILKEYRRKRPSKTFGTVFDWADDLSNFLISFFNFTDADEDALAERAASSAVSEVVNRFLESIAEDPEGELKAEFDMHVADMERLEDHFTPAEWQKLRDRLSPVFDTVAAGNIVQALPTLQQVVRRFAELVVRKQYLSPASRGLVVAGFGENELLPSLVAYEMEGIIGGSIKREEVQRFDATRKSRGLIQPFAQSDMVYRFMEGIDPELLVQLRASLGKLLLNNARETATALGTSKADLESMEPAFKAAVTAAEKEFWKDADSLRTRRFSKPVIDMAMSLPKDELAHLAESLVSLTSLQRRVSREIETVGGAVDVAVISKGDGFVWIKRKHYFRSDLNLRFTTGYLSEYQKAAGEKINAEGDE